MLNKVKCISVYDLNHKTFVQAIRQFNCPFSYVLPAITSVWKFDGKRRFLKAVIFCKNMLDAYKIIDSDLGVPLRCLLDWIEVCSIADYIICLKCVSVLLKLVLRSVPLYNIISMCFVVVSHNCSIPVF